MIIIGQATALGAGAQSVDSLAANLSSPLVAVRATSITALAGLPPNTLTPATRASIIALLNREASHTIGAADTSSADAIYEVFKEYIIELSSLAMRLNDSQALPGLTRLGIQTSQEIQDYVAQQGSAAIPLLDDAWQSNVLARSAIVDTWGRLLAVNGGVGLDSATRALVLRRVAGAVVAYPIPVAELAQDLKSVALLPDLYLAYDSVARRIPRQELTNAIATVQAQIAAQSATQLLADLATGTAAFCGATGQHGACEAVLELIATTARHVRQGELSAAHNTLSALIKRADSGRSDGSLPPSLARFVIEVGQAIDVKLG